MKQFLLTALKERLSSEQWSWLQSASGAIEAGAGLDAVLSSYTAASRRLGKRALQLNQSEQLNLAKCSSLPTIDRWGADEAARAVFLLSLEGRSRGDYALIVQQCYERGDSREQQSWLRSLSLLSDNEMFLQTAIDSCRTNIIPVFEAIACENPYPSERFPELNFNQMVLKSLFNRIALSRIAGLESRLNPDLSRMANDYARELNAAGRPVPKDIGLVTPFPS